jgi:serine-type D-Ala-D-Ala carboxypeptidase (penicillin-binding protein 5/6)
MSAPRSVLEEGRAREPRRRRRELDKRRRRPPKPPRRWRKWVAFGLVGAGLAVAAVLILMAPGASGPAGVGDAATTPRARPPVRHAPARSEYGIALAPASRRLQGRVVKGKLTSGMLFDVHTGRVMWERNPGQQLPIASLTKMMTALVVVDKAKPNARVLITRQATQFTGSGVGELPVGKRVPPRPLLYGLLLPSGNDAAVALAQHVAHSQTRFVAMMNERAHRMGLSCTHFTTVSGIVDRGNHSCAADLALMAHTMLQNKLLAKIVRTRNAVLPFPIKSHRIWLNNNNPLEIGRYPGIDGVKTGFTDAAGLCIVATARRGRNWLGVVLLHSENWTTQAEQLLDAGFVKLARS